MKKLVVLSGSGISAESGISTFRGGNGLWDNEPVEAVATIDGWYRDPARVLRFYNERRAQLATVEPNEAHTILAELEKDFEVTVITQRFVPRIPIPIWTGGASAMCRTSVIKQ